MNILKSILPYGLIRWCQHRGLHFPRRKSSQERRIQEWYARGADNSLRLDYALDASSIVFDLGAFQGDWTAAIFSRYACTVYAFEPSTKVFPRLQTRFGRNPKIHLFPFGLGARDETLTMSIAEESSSTFAAGKQATLPCPLRNAAEFIRSQPFDSIDLMKINIEGGEYNLLDHLLEQGLVSRIRNLQIQFHDFVPHAETRMADIQRQLTRTHELTYQFTFVWENWRQRSPG